MATDDSRQWGIAAQGRVYCQQYLVQRSLKAGAQLKKLRLLLHGMSAHVSDDLAERLLEIITTMENLNPNVYDSCSSKLKVTMSSDEQVKWAYSRIVTRLLATGVTWGKVISIFSVCGALASDCVSQGHTNFLPVILDCFEETCSQSTVNQFLKDYGGWRGVADHYFNKLQSSSRSSLPSLPKVFSKITTKSLVHKPEILTAAFFALFVIAVTCIRFFQYSSATKI